ncbi:hypothetical protein QA802_07445 [Streptomyces sp. B21-105]|uniref:hypothetical protein n=1 Tax=Streptomyces sp. B21-105 TaxID=3039417 RepID=UPI002FEEC15A
MVIGTDIDLVGCLFTVTAQLHVVDQSGVSMSCMARLKPGVAAVAVGPRTVPALDAWRSAHGF